TVCEMRSGSETHLRRIFSLELPVESPLQCAGRISAELLPCRIAFSERRFVQIFVAVRRPNLRRHAPRPNRFVFRGIPI
uniref:hypothetical protein n=1 Tax=Alistipes shahii TaxID=328814 RepID=UPI003AB116FB